MCSLIWVNASSTETPRVLARAPVGLLDGRPRGEGYLELLGQDLSLSNGALLLEFDDGGVGEELDDFDVLSVEPAHGGAGQVVRADYGGAVPAGERVHDR